MKYIAAPENNTMRNPAVNTSMTARMGASTETQPYTAQAQGINLGSTAFRSETEGEGNAGKEARGHQQNKAEKDPEHQRVMAYG
jgi:hypothetical protein